MLSIAHTLASLPFGVYLQNPLLILILTFAFHLFLDTLLHWNIYPRDFKRYPFLLVALDVGGGLLVAWLLLGTDIFLSAPIIAAIIGGNLPDVLHAFWEFLSPSQQTRLPKLIQGFFHFHHDLQRETNDIARGLVSQVIIVALSIILLLIPPLK